VDKIYRKHHSASGSGGNGGGGGGGGGGNGFSSSVLMKRKRQGSKSASAELSATSPIFEIPPNSIRQQQRKSVDFGITNNSMGACSPVSSLHRPFGAIGGDVVDHNAHSNAASPSMIVFRNPSIHVSSESKVIIGSVESLLPISSHSHGHGHGHHFNEEIKHVDRVEDGYDGASETGRCETDGLDEFDENDSTIGIDVESSSSPCEWNQPMDVQMSGKGSASAAVDYLGMGVGGGNGAAAQIGKKRRVRSRKSGDRTNSNPFNLREYV
jgi:hypothetical protein